MGFTNPLTGPIVVAGGTIDSVANVTGDVLGNLHGSAGSVAGNVAGSTGSVTGAVGSVTGNVNGNLAGNVLGSVASVVGSVASVLGSVASVIGSVASVLGSVASVVGNVGGNVAGSTGSVTGNVAGSVGSVTGAVGSVTGNVAGNVSGSVAGSVASVLGNVLGTVASVVGNVAGSVASVTGNVTPDPTSTIATVSTSVPFPFRDAGFWPAISGEQFPPTFSNFAYSSGNYGLSFYNANGSANATLTGPSFPRAGFNGKTNLHFECVVFFNANNAGAANTRCVQVGINASTSAGATARKAYFFVGSRFSGGNQIFDFSCSYADNAAETNTAVVYSTVAVASGQLTELVKLSIDIATNGTITFSVNNVVKHTSASGIWPGTLTPATTERVAAWGAVYNPSAFFQVNVARVAMSWT